MKRILLFVLLISAFSIYQLNAQSAVWAEKIAGTGNDYGEDIVSDKNGNVYVIGGFHSSTLTLNNNKSLSNIGSMDIFIAKYNSNGVCQWVEKIAGSSDDLGLGIALDSNSNILVTGYTNSSTLNFNNNKSLIGSGQEDAFLAKYDNSGTCQWAEIIAGTNNDRAYRIATDENGNIFVTGWYSSSTLTFNNGKSLTS